MIFSIIFVHIILVPILYTLIVNLYHTSSSESYISHAHNIAGFVSENLTDKHVINDRQTIISHLDSTVLLSNMVFVDIIDNNSQSITPSDVLDVTASSFIEDTDLHQNNDLIYFISVPVLLDTDNAGYHTLRLGFDESFIDEQLLSIKQNVILTMVIYFIIIVIMFSLIIRFIHKPLSLLRNKSNIISSGEVQAELKVPSHITEIDELSVDLEKMRQSLLEMAHHMQIQATHDELTGLPNRYLYTDRIQQAVSLSQRHKTNFAVLLLDLDRFKEINDTLGHGLGDKVLHIISKRMSDSMRDTDTIARVGGDEFSLILIDVTETMAQKLADKIYQLITPLIEINQHTLQVSASIGIAVYPDHGDTPELLLQHADVAMYHAKHNNLHVATYNSDMDSDNYENLLLVNDFKSSIAEDHFKALYQPKIDLATGDTCGCELLLRWRHPYLGMIYPDRFIPLAEQENIIGELTRWATSRCLKKFLPILKHYPKFQVSINVSPVNLLDSNLLDSLLDIIEASTFPAQNLIIEVTENVIMKNPDRSIKILNLFCDAGIGISIDDFGTGYSSLAYLQKFPIEELKIDKTFITDLDLESTNYPIVKASIAMAHDLGMTVVAEGIENQQVHDILIDLGCDRVQGYHYAKPMHFTDLQKWLSV